MSTLSKVLKVIAWLIGLLWLTFFCIAVAYKDDPVVRAAVRSMAVSIASTFSDVRELKNQIKTDVKQELKKESH